MTLYIGLAMMVVGLFFLFKSNEFQFCLSLLKEWKETRK